MASRAISRSFRSATAIWGSINPRITDVTGTLKAAIDQINHLPTQPEFLLHTGDISHLSKPEEFDNVEQILKSANAKEVFYVPGEHDVLDDQRQSLSRTVWKERKGRRMVQLRPQRRAFYWAGQRDESEGGGLGSLGEDQLAWMEDDVQHLKHSTPIVVFAHIPLWSVYPEWGWGTEDSAQALSYLKKFGSVTVLNGHIHQIMQKVEGNVTFHTAMSTAFPQPQPGKADSPGPMKVPAEQLRTCWELRM